MAEYTQEELNDLKLTELKSIATDYGISVKGLKKADLIAEILEYVPEDADELDDDELDDPIEVGDSDEVDDDESELDDSPEEDDELDDEELDDVEVEAEPEPEPKPKKAKKVREARVGLEPRDGEEVLAAKQVAALINTDPKTLRQFFRSPASTTEPCGSGGRYEFYESQVDQIRNEFSAWMENKATRKAKDPSERKPRAKKERVIPEEEIAPEIEDLEDELDELEDDFDDELDD